jgi:hypothetical protein
MFDQWKEGFDDARADMRVIADPVQTNRHTLKEYFRILDKTERAVYVTLYGKNPSAYDQGYADGADVESYFIYKERDELAEQKTEGLRLDLSPLFMQYGFLVLSLDETAELIGFWAACRKSEETLPEIIHNPTISELEDFWTDV